MTQTTLDPEEIAKFSAHAKQWWDREGPLKTLHDVNEVRLKFITDIASLNQLKILDVGCGGGILSEAMAKQGAEVIGLDVDNELLDVAKAHAEEQNVKVRYVCSPIEDYQENSFHIITCMEMLEHVPNPSKVIEEAARLLKPGGLLFLSTINRTVKAYLSVILAGEYILKLLPRQTHDFQKFIKPSELAYMLRQAGFEVTLIKGMSYNPFTREAKLSNVVGVNYLVSCFKL